jgi:hypothetical protein
MLRLARAFVAGGLVEHQRGEFGIGPIDAVDGENEIFGIDFDEGIFANLAVNRDAMMADETAASLAGAEAVFLEEAF